MLFGQEKIVFNSCVFLPHESNWSWETIVCCAGYQNFTPGTYCIMPGEEEGGGDSLKADRADTACKPANYTPKTESFKKLNI